MIIYVCIVCIHQAVPRLLHATVHRDALRRTEEQGHRRGGLGATPPKLSRRKIGKLKLKLKMVNIYIYIYIYRENIGNNIYDIYIYI